MRGVVPVLFAAHLLTFAVTRQVSALNPALRIPPNVVCNPDTEKINRLMRKCDATAQKQEFVSPSLQSSLRCQTHAFFATARLELKY